MVFAAAVWQSRDRVVGTLQPGAPELREQARFNRDAVAIAGNYDTGLDWLTVVFEAKDMLTVVMGASILSLTPATVAILGVSAKLDGDVSDLAALIVDN